MMPYTTQKLITEAFYLGNLLSRNGEFISDQQITDGLERLNGFLALTSIDIGMIPYFSEITIAAVPGQQDYIIPDLIEVETCTFNLQDVRYPMTRVFRQEFYGTGRVDNINSLPFEYFFQRVLEGGKLSLYFKPQENYPIKIQGKFQLADVGLNLDLSQIMQRFYIEYLLYGLCDYLCQFNNAITPIGVANNLLSIKSKIRELNKFDLSMVKKSTIAPNTGINWAVVNLSNGFFP